MKRSVPILVLALLGGFAAWYWSRPRAAATEPDAETPVATVDVAPLRRQEIAQTLHTFGVIVSAPGGELAIAAPYECLVRAIHVRTGTRVAPGETLIEIAPSPAAQLDLDSARDALVLASAALANEQERYALQLATSQDLLAAQQSEREARLKLESLTARGLDGDGRIGAATAGTVAKVEITVGTIVPAGATLIVVNDEQRLEASLSVEAAELSQVRPGQQTILASSNRRDSEPLPSEVRQTGGAIDPVTGAADVRVPVPGSARLLPGEHVTATIELLKRTALVAPRSALLPDGTKWVLFTVQADHAIRHEVTPGIVADDIVEVTGNDLHANDRVVTLGNYELTDGMLVRVSGAESVAAQEGVR